MIFEMFLSSSSCIVDCRVPNLLDSYDSVMLIYVMHFQLLRKLADKVAAAGFYTVVPDFLKGDPYNPENVEKPATIWIKEHGPVSYLFSFSILLPIIWNYSSQ